ncbi:proteoglycan 4-like [Forsythia ovata]|uniref:Proteoglycan 4-like n=1 Tax=Forsythia ovata TaxID=205694 RepID=A0ABD1SN54_9LAMI
MANWFRNPNAQVKKHSIINHSSTESYTSQTESVIGFRHIITDDHHRPSSLPQINLFKDHVDVVDDRSHFPLPRINLFKDHVGVVDDRSHFPRRMAYDSPKKEEEFSPKELLKGAPWNSAPYKKTNPFSRDDDDHSTDDLVDDTCTDGVCLRDKKGPTKDDDYDRHGRYGGSNLPKLVRGIPEHDTDYGPKGSGKKHSIVPPAGNGRHQQYTAPVSSSPKKDTYYKTANNRPLGPSSPRSNPETDTESPKAGRNHLFEPTAGRHPQYTAPSSSPMKDTYYKTANNRPVLGPSSPRSKPETDTQSPKAGRNHLFEPTAGRHPQYTAPLSTSPKEDTYYDTAKNGPTVHFPLRRKPEFDTAGNASDSPKASRNPSFVPPATFPGKDSYYDKAFNSKPAHDNGKPKYAQQPQFSAPVMTTQPRKDGHQQTIDSREAAKLYGGKAVDKPTPEQEYVETIDCKEAARKYKGIFVP